MDIVRGFRNIQEMARAVRESAELLEGRQYSPQCLDPQKFIAYLSAKGIKAYEDLAIPPEIA